MPKVTNSAIWAVSLRKSVSKLSKGWTVEDARGNVRLVIRIPEQPKQSVVLPLSWNELQADDAYIRIRNIYSLVAKDGYSLKQAAEVCSGKAPKKINQIPWAEYINDFKEDKTNRGNTIALSTWDKEYFLSPEIIAEKAKNVKGNMKPITVFPVLNNALALLEKGSVSTPKKLIDESVKNWTAGTRSRQQAVRNLSAFLRWCVDEEKIPPTWMPRSDLSHHIGVTPNALQKPEILPEDKAVNDHILVELIDHVEGIDQRWAYALKLMAELGLRPVELLHLQVKKDFSGEKDFYCTYKKKAGKGATKEGELYSVPLKNKKEVIQEWNLMEAFEKEKIQLPDLAGYKYGVADALKNFLERRSNTRKDGTKGTLSKQAEKWFELKERVYKEDKKHLTLYSFRHSYSLRSHERGIDPESVAVAMRHNLRTHTQFYPTAAKKAVKNTFKKQVF